MAKRDYYGIHLSGNVESDYLYATLLGSDLLPFTHLPLRLVVLPVYPVEKTYAMITKEGVNRRGHECMGKWLLQGEELWKSKRGDKADRFDLYQWLDYNRKLTKQEPGAKSIILYNTSGTFLTACVVEIQSSLEVVINSTRLKLNGFIADATDYYYQTKIENEAYYLAAVLNSSVLDDLVKPLQARGLWGARHIHKKPLEMPIPKFESDNHVHQNLAKLGKYSSASSTRSLYQLMDEMKIEPSTITPNAVGRLRSKIRESLKNEIIEIDNLVCKLFTD